MSEIDLWLIVVSFSGFFTSRWMLRLAPAMTELPLKTMLATLLAALAAALSFGGQGLSPNLKLVIAIVAPLFIFAPIALSSLARAKRYPLALVITRLLYWADGNLRMRRLLAQVALQQADTEAVLKLVPSEEADHLLLAQVFALEEKWDKVLGLKLPEEGDNAFLGLAARVEANIALGRLELADQELHAMREKWEREGKGPIGYRSLFTSETRLLAERGQFERVKENLQNPPLGVAANQLFEMMARASEQSGQTANAIKLYAQAFATAPETLQSKYAEKLTAYNQPLPRVIKQRRRPVGTLSLVAALLVAYGVQVWLERTVGPSAAILTAGFLDRVPNIPDANGAWRYLSYAFVHGGIIHIGMNAYVLFDIGRLFEIRRNWGNLLASFVIGSIMGAYFSQIATQGGIPLVGASGGVLGVAGALLADAIRGRSQQDRLLLRSLLQWMAFIVIFSVAIPNVSLWGHVGGVIGGMLWGFVRQGLPKNKQLDWLIGGISIGLMIYVLIAAANWFIRHS